MMKILFYILVNLSTFQLNFRTIKLRLYIYKTKKLSFPLDFKDTLIQNVQQNLEGLRNFEKKRER